MLDEPRGGHSGGSAAAPLFARVAAAQLARVGVVTMPEFRTVEAVTPSSPVRQPEPPAARAAVSAAAEVPARATPEPAVRGERGRVLLPDFFGFTVAEAQRVATASEIRLEVVGEGRAIAQEPHPGAVLAGGSVVRIRFGADGDAG
jgi:hypothetical protein